MESQSRRNYFGKIGFAGHLLHLLLEVEQDNLHNIVDQQQPEIRQILRNTILF